MKNLICTKKIFVDIRADVLTYRNTLYTDISYEMIKENAACESNYGSMSSWLMW